ncbi:hypothetical protein V3C99_007498, partial [Haemonchus contortus]
VLIYRDTEKCAAAASAKMATLQIRRMVIAYFNKKTRQVLEVSKYHKNSKYYYDAIDTSSNEEWKGDMTNISIGIYLDFVRTKNLRRNENPVVNPRVAYDFLHDENELIIILFYFIYLLFYFGPKKVDSFAGCTFPTTVLTVESGLQTKGITGLTSTLETTFLFIMFLLNRTFTTE